MHVCVFMCVLVLLHMCVHACGGERPTLGVIIQVPAVLWLF